MVFVATLYAILVWLIFFRLKWLRWGWFTGTVTVLIGMLVCAVFVGFLSYFAPTGRVQVISHVVEVTPNVSDQITEISVQPNRSVKADAVLFKIDPAPFEAQVRNIDAHSSSSSCALHKCSNCRRAVRDARLMLTSAKPRLSNCRPNSTRRNTTSTKRLSARRVTAMSAL